MVSIFLMLTWFGTESGLLMPERIQFERLGVAEGLSQSTVNCMLQDRAGYLWIGTHIGLNKYDGYRFEIYRHDPMDRQSLPANNIQALLEDARGRLWIATEGGLCRLDGRDTNAPRFQHFAVDREGENSLVGPFVSHLFQDCDGTIWLAGSGQLYRFREQTQDFERFQLPHGRAMGLAEDQLGRLWVATLGGMLVLDAERQAAQTLYGLYGRGRCQLDSFMPHSAVTHLFNDADGGLWAAFPGVGLVLVPEHLDERNPLRIPLPRLIVRDALEDEHGIFWLATSAGVLRVDPLRLNNARSQYDPKQRGSLTSNDTQVVMRDRHGTIWVGVVLGGVNKYAPSKPVFEHFNANPFLTETLHGDLIYAFAEGPEGVLWIGSRNGISAFDIAERRFLTLVGEPSLTEVMDNWQVLALHVDRKGDLWIGSTRQLVVVSPHDLDLAAGTLGHRNLRRYDRQQMGGFYHVTGFLEEADGTMWISGFGRGFWRTKLDQDPLQFESFAPSDEPGGLSDWLTRGMLRGHDGSLWIGTWNGGLNRFDETSDKFEVFRRDQADPQSLSEDTVTCLAQGSDSRYIWVGTYAGGLNRLDPDTGHFTYITARDGLPDNTVYGILVHGDDLWVSTNNGIASISNADDAQRRAIKAYSVHDGLQSQEYNRGAYFKGYNGLMYMGGINGFNLFNPGQMPERVSAGDVMLTDLFVNGRSRRFSQPLHQLQTLTLPPQTRMLGFEFSSMNYATSGQNRYAYQLDGVDRDWQRSGERRSLQYSNLAPGNYLLRAYNLDRSDALSGRELSLAFRIEPYFYQTLWFRLLLASLLTLLVLTAVRRRWLALQREQQRRRDFARGLIEAQEHERGRIADELHDSLGQNLLAINNELQLHAQMPQGQAMRADLMQMSGWVRDAIEEVRRIAYNLRPHQLDRLGLKRAIASMAGHIERGSGIVMQLELGDIEGVLSKDNETHLFRIVQECMHNIQRHAQAKTVHLKMDVVDKVLAVLIEDDGCGFDRQEIRRHHRGMGLRTLFERADLMGAQLKLESQVGRGTCVELKVLLEG